MAATLKWHDLPLPWQIAFDEGWQAGCAGSVPIGAVITDFVEFDRKLNLLARLMSRSASINCGDMPVVAKP